MTHKVGKGNGSQEALGHAVSEIRHALDDHADEPIFVQTLRGRGYRLIVIPKLVSDDTSSVVLGTKDGVSLSDIGLLKNLQRRGVFETALAYLIVGWLLIQVADIVFDQLHLPAWAGTFVTAFVIAGFPLALVLSWFLEFRDGRAVLDELSPADARKRILLACIELQRFADLCAEMGDAGRLSLFFLGAAAGPASSRRSSRDGRGPQASPRP